jgi:hypothetical protein
VEEKGDFVFPIKENQEKLYKNIQSCLHRNIPTLALEKSKPIS